MASTFVEDFEGGSDGTGLSTSNTGLTFVETPLPVFKNTPVHSGSLSARFSVSSNLSYIKKDFTSGSTFVCRFYLYITSYPTADLVFMQTRATSSNRHQVQLLTTGALRMRNGTSTVYTMSNVVPLNEWVRVEWKVVNGTGQTLRLFTGANVDTTTALEDSGSQTANNGTMNNVLYGITGSNTATFFIDGLAHDDTDWVGPLSSSTPISGTDTATGVDSGSVTARTFTSADTATAVDAADTGIVAKSGSDTASGVDSGSKSIIGAALLFEENFEGGTDGTAIDSGNSAFGFNSGTAPVFDNAQVHEGTLSALISIPGPAVDSSSLWKAYSSNATFTTRFYLRVNSLSDDIALVYVDNGSSPRARLVLLETTRLLTMVNGSTTVWTSTNAVPLNEWVRVEWKVVNGTGQTLRLFTGANVDTMTALEDSGSQTANSGTMSRVAYGNVLNGVETLWLDAIAFDTGDWIGPLGGSGTVDKTGADTASTVDSATVTARTFTAAETATTIDAQNVSATTSTAESAAGSELAAVVAASSTADIAGSAELADIGVTSADVGTGLDLASLLASLSSGDTGVATESVQLDITSLDAGSTADAATLEVTTSTADAGTSSEAVSLFVDVVATDVVSTLDVSSTGNPVVVFDDAAVVDATSIDAVLSIADIAGSVDAEAVAADVPATETGTSFEVAALAVSTTDAAAGVDVASVEAATEDADIATAAEVWSLVVQVAEDVSAVDDADTGLLTVNKTATDNASTSETVLIALAISDAASSVDSDTGLVLSVADIAEAVEFAILLAQLNDTDTVSTIDVTSLVVFLYGEDVAGTQDIAALVAQIAVVELASTADDDSTAASVSVAEIAMAIDAALATDDGIEIGLFTDSVSVGGFTSSSIEDSFSSVAIGGRFS